MATSQPTEILTEGEVDVNEAVKEILAEMEAEEQDPLEGLGNVQIAEIYHRMTPEDQRLFRQFKRFHKQYYETHGHDAPSHQLRRGIVQQMFPGLPSADADTIAKARAELLATERLKELCKQLGLAIPTQTTAVPSTTRGTRIPTATSASTIFVEARQGEGSPSSSQWKKLKSSLMLSQGGWPPHIWVPRDCFG